MVRKFYFKEKISSKKGLRVFLPFLKLILRDLILFKIFDISKNKIFLLRKNSYFSKIFVK